MPVINSRWIRKQMPTGKERWERLWTGCYLLIAKEPDSWKKFVGKVKIKGKKYTVQLGIFDKDISEPDKVIKNWREMVEWGRANNCNPKGFCERKPLKKSEKTLKEVFDLYLHHKSQHIKTIKNYKSRLNQILLKLPDGIMVDDFAGNKGRRFIKERVCDPSIANEHPYTAIRARRHLNDVFDFAVDDCLLLPEQLPYRLDKPFPLEKNIKSKSHPHLSWKEFATDFIPDLNANLFNASRLTDLSAQAVLMMLQRVSAVVENAMELV